MFKLLINSGHTCWVTQEETVLNEQSVRNCGKKTLICTEKLSGGSPRCSRWRKL